MKHPRASWLDPNTGDLLDRSVLIRDMAAKPVVLLGETHDIAEIHRWQLHVIAALHTLRTHIMVGFEMFPRRLQPVLDEWVNGELSTEAFIEKSEWYQVWGFPAEIYLPIFHFCRQNKVRMLALNCYRALVTRVGKEGWKSVPEEERDGLTSAAPATQGYVDYLTGLTARGGIPAMPAERFIRAQQTWDRAFACNIVAAMQGAEKEKADAPLIVGVVGRGHMEYRHGMVHQLSDLGVHDVGILLPNAEEEIDLKKMHGISDALYRIDMPEPRAARVNMPKNQANAEGRP